MSAQRLAVACFAGFAVLGQCGRVGAGSFMLVSGTSSEEEMCIVAKKSSAVVALASCADASSDPFAIWKWTSSGKLSNMGSQLCLGATMQRGSLGMTSCDGSGSEWEFTEDGQLRSKATSTCVTAKGQAGVRNVAFKAAAVASSTANAAHSAGMAVDGVSLTYWASRFEEPGPVSFTIDFGAGEIVDAVEIEWAVVPKAFNMHIAETTNFATVFSSDANVVNYTKVELGGALASKLQLLLRESHPLTGRIANKAVYGIVSVRAVSHGPGLQIVDCAAAAKNPTAADKVFMSQVSEFDPAAQSAYAAEVPALQSAMVSLSSAVANLAGVVPHIASCGAALVASHSSSAGTDAGGAIEADLAENLLAESRSTILLARAALV